MKITPLHNVQRVGNRQDSQKAGSGDAAAGDDQVSLSGPAQFLSSLRAAAKDMPEVRNEIIDAARADIEAGRMGTEEDYERAVDALLMGL